MGSAWLSAPAAVARSSGGGLRGRHGLRQGAAFPSKTDGGFERSQQRHGGAVLRGALDQEPLQGDYDAIVSIEVLSHIRDKVGLLRRLRLLAPRLILSVNCAADTYGGNRITFGNSMVLCTVSQLKQDLAQAGWRLHSLHNRRLASFRTVSLWEQQLDQVYGESDPSGQLGCLRNLVDGALAAPVRWCQSFPLVDVVAD